MAHQDVTLEIQHLSDVSAAARKTKEFAIDVGFDERTGDELALVASELASNLVKYASEGIIILKETRRDDQVGVQIESIDEGPGIPDVDLAVTDGFSTGGSLGYGLGTVNRIMDEMEIVPCKDGIGVCITCKRWIRSGKVPGQTSVCPFDFGFASRAHPLMQVNGDAFVLKRWDCFALVAVIDGLGHGQFAFKAAQTARRYVESHYDQSLENIFLGVGRACRATRGVVMAAVRFDWERGKFTFCSTGNVETRLIGAPDDSKNFIVRRGILGLNAPAPYVSEHDWQPRYILIMHSDGVKSHWRWEDFNFPEHQPASIIVRRLLKDLARDTDDATVVVVRNLPDENR